MSGYALVRKDNKGWAVVVAPSLEKALYEVGWDRHSVIVRDRVPYQGNRRETWVVAQHTPER